MSRLSTLFMHAAIALGVGMALSGAALAQYPGIGPGGGPGGGPGTWGGRGPGPAPFQLMDRDGNGGISAAEHAQFRADRQRAMAAQGRPMRNAASAPAFESIDANGDGQISPGEMAAMRQARMATRGGGYGPGPGLGPRGPGGFGPGGGAGGGGGRPCWRSGPSTPISSPGN